jgi:glycosyltransferase involved in cell wall biosynthesis
MIKKKSKTINLIQDLATPHNNVLISHFITRPDIKINLWYALDQDHAQYQWTTNITHEHFQATIYGAKFNWRFIKYCLIHSDELFIIVGWMNINTRLLHLLFFLLRRPYNHWTDLPDSATRAKGVKRKITRWLAYKVLKHSNSKVFGVGLITLNYLKSFGFSVSKLVNLPIFVESNENIAAYHAQRIKIFNNYNIQPDDFILIGGSRIIHEKGYDLLIKAIALLTNDVRPHIKVIIVGSGDNIPVLEALIKEFSLAKHITLEKWLAIEDFKGLIANSDVFIHPARVDSFGGTTLGMALGVPVIGSYGAGAAVDRIQQGRNGFLYEAEDIQSLANFITLLYQNPELRRRMASEALKTAQAWPPSRGVQILVDHAI